MPTGIPTAEDTTSLQTLFKFTNCQLFIRITSAIVVEINAEIGAAVCSPIMRLINGIVINALPKPKVDLTIDPKKIILNIKQIILASIIS